MFYFVKTIVRNWAARLPYSSIRIEICVPRRIDKREISVNNINEKRISCVQSSVQ